jgi:hypothetical protein
VLRVILRSQPLAESIKHQEVIMDWTLEVVVLPVSDVDRSIARAEKPLIPPESRGRFGG